MKNILIIVLCIFSCIEYCSATELNQQEVVDIIERFSCLLTEDGIDEMQSIISNEKILHEMESFLNKNTVLDFSYVIINFRPLNDKTDYNSIEVEVENKLVYKKKGGMWTNTTTYSSYFTISVDPERKSYVIEKTDFFSIIYFTKILSVFFLTSLLIIFPCLLHAGKHKRKKWMIIIILSHLIGVLLYVVFVLRKKSFHKGDTPMVRN